MGFRVGIGGGIGPFRIGVSNRGVGGGLGPISAGYSWRRSRRVKSALTPVGVAKFWGLLFLITLPVQAIIHALLWLFRLPADWWVGITGFASLGLLLVLLAIRDTRKPDEMLAAEDPEGARLAPHSPAPTESPADNEPLQNFFRLTVGDRIRHRDLGDGLVVDVNDAYRQVAMVLFDDDGGAVRRVRVWSAPIFPLIAT